MAESQNCRAALAYASRGWKVFPLRPNTKIPLTTHGFHDATSAKGQIRQWWNGVPGAGIGVATGYTSNLIVIDVDPRNGGNESLATLPDLPDTVESITGGGGRHIFLKPPEGGEAFPTTTPWPGIDIKAEGGYVVVPFSVHPNGIAYHWKAGCDPGDLSVATVPQFILDVLEEKKTEVNIARTPQDDEEYFEEGGRNNALTSLAGTMRRRGMSHDAILAALLSENTARCHPPLSEVEIEAIARSVGRYAPSSSARSADGPRSLRFSDVVAMVRADPPPIDWILEGRLARGDCSMLTGPPYIGKSWVVLDLAVTQALGLPSMGRYAPPEPRKVLVVDEENPPEETWRRLRALLRAWEADPTDLEKRLFLARGCQGFSFRDDAYVQALHQQVDAIKPDLIIFDSFSSMANVKTENDAIEVRRFFHDQVYPFRTYCNSTLLFVHHTSKAVYQLEMEVAEAGLPRGSGAFVDVPDSSLLLLPAGNNNMLHLNCLKVRRGKRAPRAVLQIADGAEGGCRPIIVNEGRRRQGDAPAAQRARAQILVHLTQNRDWHRPADLVVYVHGADTTLTDQTIRGALTQLARQGQVLSEGEGAGRRIRLAPQG
jgi:hypothetical protein